MLTAFGLLFKRQPSIRPQVGNLQAPRMRSADHIMVATLWTKPTAKASVAGCALPSIARVFLRDGFCNLDWAGGRL